MWCSCCSAVISCGTNFADTHLMHRSLVTIAWHDPEEIPSSSDTSQMVSL